MFKSEFLFLINEIKNLQGEERNQKLLSLNKLISEHKSELDDLEVEGNFTDETYSILEEAKNLSPSFQETPSNSSPQHPPSDLEKVKQAYLMWLEEFQQTRSEVTSKMSSIVQELVSFYAPRRFGVLKQILEITDSREYDIFKLHLKNNLRAYYGQEIQRYLNSEAYEQLSFLKKYRKDKEIKKVLNDISSYKFEPQHIAEVLK